MSSCPKCGSAIALDFGMVACANCNAVLFIDMEGNAHLSAAPGDAVAEAAHDPPLSRDADVAAPQDNDPDPEPSFRPVMELPEMSPEIVVEASAESPEEFVPPSAADPLGLRSFANSEMSQAKDGPLIFKVIVSGIDTKEMRESIREAMTDHRFGWDAHAQMSRVSKGTLVIDGLSPVKATVLVNRLKRLPVLIAWEQYAVTQLDGQPEDSAPSAPF